MSRETVVNAVRCKNPADMPMLGEKVYDLDRQEHGKVVKRGTSGTVYVTFADSAERIMYTYRTSLGVWKAFPGAASNLGLQPLMD